MERVRATFLSGIELNTKLLMEQTGTYYHIYSAILATTILPATNKLCGANTHSTPIIANTVAEFSVLETSTTWRTTSPPSLELSKTKSTAPSITKSAHVDTATDARVNMSSPRTHKRSSCQTCTRTQHTIQRTE
jgi:hypothetical protein